MRGKVKDAFSLPIFLEVKEDDTAWFDRLSPKGNGWKLELSAIAAFSPFSECVITVKIGCFRVKAWGFRRFHCQIHVTSFSSPFFEKGQQFQPK